MLKIITVPNPILRQKAKAVAKIDPEVRHLVKQMAALLNSEEGNLRGVGLSAPQVAISKRIIIVWDKEPDQWLTMINPKIIAKSKRTKLGVPESKNPYEGCLSVPSVWGLVRRYSIIKVQYRDLGNQIISRKFKGLTGMIIQHEIDHLDGILFIDRVAQQGGQLIHQEIND